MIAKKIIAAASALTILASAAPAHGPQFRECIFTNYSVEPKGMDAMIALGRAETLLGRKAKFETQEPTEADYADLLVAIQEGNADLGFLLKEYNAIMKCVLDELKR